MQTQTLLAGSKSHFQVKAISLDSRMLKYHIRTDTKRFHGLCTFHERHTLGCTQAGSPPSSAQT